MVIFISSWVFGGQINYFKIQMPRIGDAEGQLSNGRGCYCLIRIWNVESEGGKDGSLTA